MLKVVPIRKEASAEELLNYVLEQAENGEIKALVIITKDNFGRFEVRSIAGTGSIEKAGMCAYAQKAMLDHMIEVSD